MKTFFHFDFAFNINFTTKHFSADPATRQTGEKFGYLKKSGQKIVLKFDNDTTSLRKILCTSG
jgi:hypothetical protein